MLKPISIGAIVGLWGCFGMIFDTSKFIFTNGESFFISYALIYSAFASIGLVTLLYSMVQIIPSVYKYWMAKKSKTYTVPLSAALKYIKYNSVLSESFLSEDSLDQVNTLLSEIKSGRLPVKGRDKKSSKLVQIPKKFFSRPYGLELSNDNNFTISISCKKRGELIFLGPCINEKDMMSLWPPNSTTYTPPFVWTEWRERKNERI